MKTIVGSCTYCAVGEIVIVSTSTYITVNGSIYIKQDGVLIVIEICGIGLVLCHLNRARVVGIVILPMGEVVSVVGRSADGDAVEI